MVNDVFVLLVYIQIQLNAATSPVILSPLGGLKMTYLVMPVQLRN
jgi:DNA polymerase-3 subunit beta